MTRTAAGRVMVTTPYPSFEETANLYGLSNSERREVATALKETVAHVRGHGRSVSSATRKALKAKKKPMGRKSVRATRYTRKSFFVDERALRRARKALGVGTNAETVRLAVERVVEMEEFWRFMATSRGSLKAGSIEAP